MERLFLIEALKPAASATVLQNAQAVVEVARLVVEVYQREVQGCRRGNVGVLGLFRHLGVDIGEMFGPMVS